MTNRNLIIVLALSFSACTIEKKNDAAPSDTPAATVVTPTPSPQPAPSAAQPPAAQPPAAPPAAKPSQPAKSKTTTGRDTVKRDTLERDSAFGPTFVIGADGKVKRVKK